MCDIIIMPNGTIKETFGEDEDEVCLCNKTQSEILTWIVQQLPEIVIAEKIEIEHSPIGYEVRIVKAR